MTFRFRGLLLFGLLAFAAPAFAQRAPFPIPDPDPEVERKSFIVADGFEVNLYAADPVLAKPIQMNFDPQGRLWVVSSEVYPQIKPGQVANDKVLVLEDKNGDGVSDGTKVFADGLLIPTGIEPGDGGAYVANSTELLHMADTDGDGKADRRRVVLSGFGTEDTHHILHTLRWGFDGQLYFKQSIYIHSHIETPLGVRRLGGGGVWEFRPETMELGVFIRGLVNPWGFHFDRWGQTFATDGAGGEGINYALPGAYYFTAPDAVRILQGLNPGSPKDCGLEVISGRHLPDGWDGSLITNDFRGNRVCRYVLSDDGAGFASREQGELIKTKHTAFRPIDVKMGPDGAIYIADWYNPIIQHGEVDFRDDRRDHTRGRIWRVTAKGRPLVERPKLVDASNSELLEALKAPEGWTRTQAKRVLKERGATRVLSDLASWVANLDAKDPAYEHNKLEGLWAYQTLDVVNPELLAGLLRSPDARVRGAATRVVRYWQNRLSDPLALLAVQVADENPRVRLEAVRALAHVPDSKSVEIALRALDKPFDRFLDYALWLTCRDLQAFWLPRVKEGDFALLGDGSHFAFALQAIGSSEVVKPLLTALKAGKIPASQEENALSLAATLGQPNDLGLILDLALSDEASITASRRATLLGGLVKAAQQRKARPEGDLDRIGKLLNAADPTVVAAAARAAGVWKLESAVKPLDAIAHAKEATADSKKAAVDALAAVGSPDSVARLEALTRGDLPRAVQSNALGALATLDPHAGAVKAVDWLQSSTDPSEAEEIVARFAKIKGGPDELTKALEGKTLKADSAKLALRAATASGQDMTKLVDAIRKAGGLGEAAAAWTTDEKTAFLSAVASEGNAARGEAIFRRSQLQCLNCHAIAGAGGQVGPSLESIGASAPVDYILDALLEPNKAVKENYHSLIVATNDGQVYSGIQIRRSDNEIVLRDANDREVSIPRSAVEAEKPGGSLMPAGLIEPLTRTELTDLVRFLSEIGKIGNYSVGKARVIRRWQVLESTPESRHELRRWGLQVSTDRENAQLKWIPVYSEVSGSLPLKDLPASKLKDQPGWDVDTVFVRAQIDVSTAGKIKLLLSEFDKMQLWVDGTSIDPLKELILDLKTGVHTLNFAIPRGPKAVALRCELEDLAGSPAKAQAVVGK